MSFRHVFLLATSLMMFIAAAQAEACTSIRIKTEDGNVFQARTMEYALPQQAGVSVVPAGTVFTGTLPDGSPGGMVFTAKYGFVGMNSHGIPVNIDGMNEKGLVASGLLFPGFAEYPAFDPAQAGKTISQFELVNWLLSQFATVAQVRQGLSTVNVCQGSSTPRGIPLGPLPLHFTVHDATGDSIVIEHVGGKTKVHDNPLGVLTNAPDFDWMRIYLSNFVNLSAVNATPRDLAGFKVNPTGQGSGMLGLPGDFTPPSRFLRMVALTQSAAPVRGADAGLALAITIINNVDIPYGTVRDMTAQGEERDVTQWVAVADLARGRYYFRTYDNKNWRYVDLKLALDRAGKVMQNIPSQTPLDYPEVSATAKPTQMP